MAFTTKWIKTGKLHDFVFLGKEIIATACGNHVIFYNLATREERIEYFNSPLRGEGSCCLAGHEVIPIFSTAERRLCPKIYIHTYPEIRKIAECKLDPGQNSYLSCCFAGTEYLLSLTSYPYFQLIIWLWRTGEKVHSIETSISDLYQTIEMSIHSVQMLYQFSPRSGKLCIHEMHVYSKKVAILSNSIKINDKKVTSAHWMNNGNLLLSDSSQNVYIANADGKKIQLILLRDVDVETMNVFSIVPYNNTFLTVDNDSEISCYRKSCSENSEKWNLKWSIHCKSHPLKMVPARHKESFLICCQNGEILELDLICETKSNFTNVCNNFQKIKHLCILNPDGLNIAVIDFSNCLHVIDVFSGIPINNFILNQEDQVLCMESHPHIPLLAVGTSTGKVMFFIKSDTNCINLETVRVQKEPLNNIRFARNGHLLGVTSTESKNFFMLNTITSEKINVCFYKEFTKPLIDFLIFENDEKIILLVLLQTVANINVSNFFEIYTIHARENAIIEKRVIIANHCYRHLNYCSEKCGDFLGIPYLSKTIELFEFSDNFRSVQLFNIINSTHKIRKFHVSTFKEYLLSCGFDGSIILRSCYEPDKVIRTFMTHHYQERGTKSSVLSPNYNIIVSLGNNGSLICMVFSEIEDMKKSRPLLNYKEIKNFIRLHKGADVLKSDENFIWLESEKLKIEHKEMNKVLSLKTVLLEDLKSLKQQVRRMLDLNEMKSVECQISTSAFDFNSQSRKEKFDSSVIRQETEMLKLQDIISKKESIAVYIIQQFWNTYEVHDSPLTSFDSEFVVKNYKLCHVDKPEKTLDFFIDLFDIPLPKKSIKFNNMTIEEEIKDIYTNGENFLTNVANASDIFFPVYSNDEVLSGSTSYRYIVNDIPPNQLSNIVFDTITSQFSREYQLKVYFNNKFNEMKCLKNKVLEETKQQLKLLNAHQKELQDTFGVTVENPYSDESKWELDESLATLITVTLEKSLSNNLSISALNSTYQNLSRDLSNSMDHSASTLPEHEQLFREDKLVEMMDGLLEIRWEDQIKKEISIPNCMRLKHPSKYNDEDIKAVAVYKLKMEKLRIERKKYRNHLESQIQCINDKIKADMESFNNRMEEFALEKIQIQSAILQEFLLRLNKHKQKFLKDRESKKISSIINNDLASLENENQLLGNEIMKIEPTVGELRNKYDNLNKRDKVLETKFRSEFGDLKQPLVEHLLRQYKRRPKIGQISCTSLTCLAETNKCLVSGKKSAILPQEYLEFLRGMDVLDIMPNSLPPQIDGNHWQLLCKLRRTKLEMEIKVKIAALELAETEQTYFHLQKLSSVIQSKIYFMKSSVEEENLNQIQSYQDSEIQLILKAGQIEIYLMGSIKDFEMSTVVTYDQLVQINVDIVKEGQKKIAAIQTEMFDRKSILYRRWKYQCMSTKLKHWQDQLAVLQNIKIGKDMQNYLVERLQGNVHYKDNKSCRKVLNSTQKKFERMLKEEKTALRRISKEIKYWREMNVDLANRIEFFESLKQHQKFELEETHLQKRNRTFHKHNLRAIMERTNLIEKLKESRNELLNLQTQLELLKLKTYPTLRFKDICHHKIGNNSIKS